MNLNHKIQKEKSLWTSYPNCCKGFPLFRALVTGIEKLLGGRSGEDKKDAALSFVQAALSMSDAITNRQIVDEQKFKDGLGKVIDGTVECLNASMWAKQN